MSFTSSALFALKTLERLDNSSFDCWPTIGHRLGLARMNMPSLNELEGIINI